MSPRDVPGHLQIDSLFPWLAQLAPATERATEPARPAASPAPPAPLAPRRTPADLPRAA